MRQRRDIGEEGGAIGFSKRRHRSRDRRSPAVKWRCGDLLPELPRAHPSPRGHSPAVRPLLAPVYLILEGILTIDLRLPRAGARPGRPVLLPHPSQQRKVLYVVRSSPAHPGNCWAITCTGFLHLPPLRIIRITQANSQFISYNLRA